MQQGFAFAAHEFHGLRGWADKTYPGGGAGPGKIGIFSQESVAGMQGVSAAGMTGLEQGPGVEVTFPGRRRADGDGMVGLAHMPGIAIRIRIHGNCLYAQ